MLGAGSAFASSSLRSEGEPRGSLQVPTEFITSPLVKNSVLGAGFEPAEPLRATVLQTVAIVHSAIPADQLVQDKLEPTVGFEPTTYCLQNSCSTAELNRQFNFPILHYSLTDLNQKTLMHSDYCNNL